MTGRVIRRTMWMLMVVGVVAQPARLYADDAAEQPTNTSFMVELTDGSALLCQPKLSNFSIRTSFADISIPIERVASLEADPDKDSVSLTFVNDDRLQGQWLLDDLTIMTILGELTIPRIYITTLTSTIEKPLVFDDSPAKRSTCINQLRQIDGAKEQWAMATRKSNGAVVDISGVNQYIKGGRTPVCPAGGTYSYNTIGVDPACNVPGHSFR